MVCLWGGEAQRNLKPSQFCRETNPDRYVYVENGSKNHSVTFGRKQSNKVVTLYSQPDAVPKCVVYLIDLYFSKFPKPPENIPFFYLKPVGKVPDKDEAPWFYELPIGKNTLGNLLTACVKMLRL